MSTKTKVTGVMPLPGPKKSPAKNNKGLLIALLLGGAGLLFFGLLIVAVGIWFLFFRGEDKGPPIASGPTVGIKLFAARAPGDVRQVALTGEEIRSISAPPVDGKLVELPAQTLKVGLRCKIKTLEVDVTGGETKVEVSHINAVLGYPNEDRNYPEAKDANPVLIGTIARTSRGRTTLFKDKQSGADLAGDIARILSWACARDVGGLILGNDDAVFGTPLTQAIGGSWDVNKNAIKASMSGGVVRKMAVSAGSAKLLDVVKDEGEDAANVEVTFKATGEPMDFPLPVGNQAVTANVEAVCSYRVPLANFRGPTRWSCRIENTVQGQVGGPDVTRKETVEGKVISDCKLEITYLPSESPEIAPAPTTPEPMAKLSMRILTPKVEWVPGQKQVNVNATFHVYAGKPRPDATYTLNIAFADAGGAKKIYKVQDQLGSKLDTDGRFLNLTLAVTVPPPAATRYCDLTLVEKVPGDANEVELDKVLNVVVSGSPPAPPPSAQPAVVLSNAKVERLANKTMRFTVDYEFTSGSPDPESMYQLTAKLKGTKIDIKQPIIVQGKGNSAIFKQGTVAKEMKIDSSADAKYELFLTQILPNYVTGKTVSNVLAGATTGTAPDNATTTPGLQIQIGLTIVKKLQTGASASVQWRVTAGQINPQATYTCVVDLKGSNKKSVGPQNLFMVPGTQMQPQGTVTQQIVYVGEGSYDVIIYEQLPGSPQQRVSDKHNGKVVK
jgi:hypothetical protein